MTESLRKSSVIVTLFYIVFFIKVKDFRALDKAKP